MTNISFIPTNLLPTWVKDLEVDTVATNLRKAMLIHTFNSSTVFVQVELLLVWYGMVCYAMYIFIHTILLTLALTAVADFKHIIIFIVFYVPVS